MESKKINQLATELTPSLADLTIIGDPSTGISKKITLSQMAALFTGTVEEYPSFSSFPVIGVADTIYIATDTNVLYRWNTGTSAYVELSPNIIASLVFNDSNGFDGTISLVGSTATLTITTTLTSGSVAFGGASGALSQDNSNFYWDNTNKRHGINTNAPTTTLDVFGSGIIGRFNGTSTNNAFLGFASNGTNRWSIGNVQSDHRFRIYNEATTSELATILSTGEFGIGIANPTTKFHIDGAASALIVNLDADVSIAKSISFRSDNSNRWNIEVSGTESTGNAGMNYFLRSYSDAGALIETPLSIVRSTGVTTIKSLTLTNALSAANGGTGIISYTIGDLIYASGSTTLAKLADVATGNALISGGVGVAPSWGKIDLTTTITGTLPVANGGTGATTFTAGRVLFGNGTSAINTSANLFWDNTNGRLGLGTDAPAVPFHISTSGLPLIRIVAGSESRTHNISAVNNGRDLQILPFRGLTLQTGNGIAEGVLTLNAYENLVIGTGASYTTRINLSSTGDLTLTTANNQGGLFVTSAQDNTTIRVGSTATGGQEWRLQATGGTSGLGQGKLIFKVGTTESEALIPLILTTDNSTNGGRVGIGKVTPIKKLDIFDNNANGTDDIVRAYQDVTTNHAFYRSQRNGGANMVIGATRSNTDGNISGNTSILWNYSAHDMVFGTNSVERMRISSGGGLLSITNNTTNELRLNSTAGTYRSFIGFRTDGQKWDVGVNLNDVQDALSFNFAGSERIRISTNGNIHLNQKLINSFTVNPANVNSGASTSYSITQPTFEYQSTYLVSIIGLYTSSGSNQNGFGTGFVTFFNDSAVAQANVTTTHANGWSISASANTSGTFTFTFTNAAGTQMSNIWIRILKLNKTFDN